MRTLFLVLALGFAVPAVAQDRTQTLADIRQELTILYVEIQKLRRELSTTGSPSVQIQGTNALDRINAMESELVRLTASTEQLTNRVDRVVADGTNRIGDLEFRLVELEGGDLSKLGETTTLGGGEMPAVSAAPGTQTAGDTGGVELAAVEQDDFNRANAALEGGEYERAAELFQNFTDTYQGGPLTGEAHLLRGQALQSLGLTSSAARAYLESYSGSPNGPRAPDALLRLGLALDGLGQSQEACITLGEVTLRYPASAASLEAQAARANMACS